MTAAATLVFDEIDAGIGGRVAEVVGRKLQELAASNQVICVTHLPQIASFASTHFFVWKEEWRGHTRARIRKLDNGEERVAEIARMLGGEKIPQSAVVHAREPHEPPTLVRPGRLDDVLVVVDVHVRPRPKPIRHVGRGHDVHLTVEPVRPSDAAELQPHGASTPRRRR